MLTVDLFGPKPNEPPPAPPSISISISISALTQPPTVTNAGDLQHNHNEISSPSQINYNDNSSSPSLENSTDRGTDPDLSVEETDPREVEDNSDQPANQNKRSNTAPNQNINARNEAFPKISSNFDKAPNFDTQGINIGDNTKEGADKASQSG